jgi:tRNA (guanine-N7-)-methyltransferase
VQTSIYTPSDWLKPLDWRKVFARSGPIEVDVGSGKGSFLLWIAQSKPATNFLGVERLPTRARKIDKKILKLGLENVRLIRVEAGYLVGKLVPDESVRAYHIYFPDPWPKRRHHRRRLLQAGFVADLHRTLQPGGAVNVATDHEEYFEQIARLMTGHGGFVPTELETLPAEAKTDFEREFATAGRPIYRGRYVRAG